MRKPNRWLVGETVLVLGLLLGAFWLYRTAAHESDFHGDEGKYIAWGRYFGYLFLERDLSRPEWNDTRAVHAQPMMTDLIVGGWLWSRGYDLERLPQPYTWRNSPQTNRRLGRIPSDRLLEHARAPMVVLAAGSIVLLYGVGRLLGGRIAGLAAAALGIASPLTHENLIHAVPDAPLAFFFLLTLLASLLGMRRGRAGGLLVGWSLAVGVALGLTIGAKLTGLLSFAATAAWGGLVALAAAYSQRLTRAGARLSGAWSAGRGWALVLVTALVVFVLSNPHLYLNPVEHTLHLFGSRVDETLATYRTFPQDAVRNPWERPGYVLRGSLIDGTFGGSRGLPVEALLAVVGAATLVARTWRGWRRSGDVPADGLVLLTGLAYFVGISAGLLLAFPRYYLPTLLLGALLGGLGLAVIVGQASRLKAAFGARARLTTPLRQAAPQN